MTFDPNIPQAAQRPSLSQGHLLTNFTALNTVFGVDHLAFNAVNGGKHTQSTYRSTGVFPAPPGNLAGEGSVYVSNSGGTRQQLYYQRESGGIEIPITPLIGGFCRVSALGALVGDNFNVAGVVYAAGVYTITFTNNLTSTNYAALVTVHDSGEAYTQNSAVGSIGVVTALSNGAAIQRPFSLLIIGEIA